MIKSYLRNGRHRLKFSFKKKKKVLLFILFIFGNFGQKLLNNLNF